MITIAALSLPTEEEKRAILLIHNQYRAKHHAPALVWNDTAADFGNEWISKCNFEHSGGGPNKFGENLAWGTGAFDYKDAVDFWYSEVKNYNYSQPGFSANTGHFTQVVWKSTTSVGCAKYACPRPNAPTTIVNMIICDYDPAGNITNEGYFAANVQAP
ncbi:hypothetical protein BGX28_007518 [Mortierella sp. GBA30]|nr:hypothetical protein BGX28_007518 [Mortierella sp. GBA30]